MKRLEQFAQDRIDVQCLVCDWKGRWEDVAWDAFFAAVVNGNIKRAVCPHCGLGKGCIITAEERKADDFWEIRPGLKEKIAALKRASKPIPPCP